VFAKPGDPYSVGEMAQDLPRKIRAAVQARIARPDPRLRWSPSRQG